MASFNKVMLLGNLTRDPEMKYLPSGTAVCEFGMAMNRQWTDQQSGQKREAVTFVDCKTMGRPAEILAQYRKKGEPLFIEGRLDFRQWDGPDGTKRSKLEVFVENFQFIGSPKGQGEGAPGQEGGGGRPPRPEGRPAPRMGSTTAAAAGAEPMGGGGQPVEDDVPF